jgi:hypothetical protein
MKTQLDMNKIAKGLRASARYRIDVTGGYFGAAQLAADIKARFRIPSGGGRPTNPHWTERRLVPFAPQTLKRLERLSKKIREHGGGRVEPMQLAGLLLEKTSAQLNEDEAEKLMRTVS